MKVSILSSGSKGNSTLIITENYKILIDVGTSCLYLEKSLNDLGISPSEITHIFITHTHIDHVSGLKVFHKKYKPIVYLTKKMHKELDYINESYKYIEQLEIIDVLKVTAFKTSHDSEDSLGYVFENGDKSLVYITDTGYINNKNKELLKNRSLYILESNHDVEMLMNTNRPHYLKIRILGDKGHLSNVDCANYLSEFVGEKTMGIVLAHLSEEANSPELAYKTINEALCYNNKQIDNIIIARQNQRTDLIEV